jgi:hypothetical protein
LGMSSTGAIIIAGSLAPPAIGAVRGHTRRRHGLSRGIALRCR